MTPSRNPLAPRPGNQPGRRGPLLRLVGRAFTMQPVSRPSVDRNLAHLPPIERAAEVLRYTIQRAEYWLSPGGFLRAVLRLSMTIGLMIGLPVIIIGPVIMLLVKNMAAAAALLAASAMNLATMSFWLIAAVIGFALLIALVRTLLRRN